jgi:SnoaL-like domain
MGDLPDDLSQRLLVFVAPSSVSAADAPIHAPAAVAGAPLAEQLLKLGPSIGRDRHNPDFHATHLPHSIELHIFTCGVIASVPANTYGWSSELINMMMEIPMRDAARLADDYIALWNETDHARRMSLLAATWTKGATYVDPLMHGAGHGEIEALVAAVHAKFPAFRFSLLKAADGFGHFVRFSWGLGPDGQEPIIKGTDFVAREGDQIKSVVGFLDQVPSGA